MPHRDSGRPVHVRWRHAIARGAFVLLLAGTTLLAKGGITPNALQCSPLNPWVSRNAGMTQDFSNVSFLNGMFFAVGASSNIFASSDGLIWTNWRVTSVPPGIGWDDIA